MMTGSICPKLRMGGTQPRGNIHSKNVSLPFGHYQATDAKNGIFVVTVQYAFVCHMTTLGELGCTRHYHLIVLVNKSKLKRIHCNKMRITLYE